MSDKDVETYNLRFAALANSIDKEYAHLMARMGVKKFVIWRSVI